MSHPRRVGEARGRARALRMAAKGVFVMLDRFKICIHVESKPDIDLPMPDGTVRRNYEWRHDNVIVQVDAVNESMAVSQLSEALTSLVAAQRVKEALRLAETTPFVTTREEMREALQSFLDYRKTGMPEEGVRELVLAWVIGHLRKKTEVVG